VVCPQVRGATNWYSTAYDPATRLFYVQAVEDCGYYRQGQGYFPYSNPADPPRKVLRAIDIETGTIAWEQSQVGIPEANYSGVLSTGGLVFHGENTGSFHAADARNGRSLWSFAANQAWKASPMTYAVGGRQFVAIAAGAGNILAFALPGR
jgi:alcohol dehydrogenase (cytochrome c)